MIRDHESRDLAGAEHFAAADAEPPEPPHPSEYEDECDLGIDTDLPCRCCGEYLTPFGRTCPRCKASLEHDRLERESGR